MSGPRRRRRSSAAQRARQERKRSTLRRWQLSTWRASEINACIHCTQRVRTVHVLFPGRARPQRVYVSTKPSPTGEVYRNQTGDWRVLRPNDKRFRGVEFYQLHGYLLCSDEAAWLGEARPLVAPRVVAGAST